MYDGYEQPGRNDECWCGSGRKYKKCHRDFDERLQGLADQGYEVPSRDLLKMPADIEAIKYSAEVNVGVLDYVAEHIAEGISTKDIDTWVYDYTTQHDAIPAPLNYEGFPCSVCTSINDVVCHGIPSDTQILKSGDIINVDCSTIRGDYFSDSSRMFCIGEVSPEHTQLVEVCKQALEKGLEAVKPWGFLGDVGAAVKEHAEAHGYSVVREFGGHGIGFEFHEEPFVSHVSTKGTGMILVPGLVFTIEPMINLGSQTITMPGADGWTVRTKDGKPSAQWEVQIAITEDGYELLSW